MFHELASKPESEADQVRDSIETMISRIKKKTPYGEVLGDSLYLKNSKTFKYIVKELSSVSFNDSSLDSKGAAFEYFVRATLKGKKLGQYFTPRPVVQLMSILIGRDKILNTVASGESIKVLDPACGTGGFLVFLMQDAINRADEKTLTKTAHETILKRIRQDTFFGADANDGVACSAKMNMIIAGDGHTNIRAEDSLSAKAQSWNISQEDCDIIITNPPFGTSETDSLEKSDWGQFSLKLAKGQQLFIQKMLACTKPQGDICTVIDDGLLNTASSTALRQLIFQSAKVRAVIRLPEDTFKPNKINVRSSVLLLEKWKTPDLDLDNDYAIAFIDLKSLGYIGSGDNIRGFDIQNLFDEIEQYVFSKKTIGTIDKEHWSAFTLAIDEVKKDGSYRLDLKYWDPQIIKKVEAFKLKKAPTIKDVNTIKTRRGNSPKAENYVDEKDGYALVVKAGSNITKYGQIIEGEDYIEKDIFDEMGAVHLQQGDILIASTGTGTLGKVGVYDLNKPAIADGHVTIVRVNQDKIYPYYLADYLRMGAGAAQIERLYTGSTGLIELTPEDVDRIYIDLLKDIASQKKMSQKLRKEESLYIENLQNAEISLLDARKTFSSV